MPDIEKLGDLTRVNRRTLGEAAVKLSAQGVIPKPPALIARLIPDAFPAGVGPVDDLDAELAADASTDYSDLERYFVPDPEKLKRDVDRMLPTIKVMLLTGNPAYTIKPDIKASLFEMLNVRAEHLGENGQPDPDFELKVAAALARAGLPGSILDNDDGSFFELVETMEGSTEDIIPPDSLIVTQDEVQEPTLEE